MLLAFDIGNSSISVGVFDLSGDSTPELVTHFNISSSQMSADEFTVHVKDFLLRNGIYDCSHAFEIDKRFIDCAAISSVVPSLTDVIFQAAMNISGKRPFVVSSGIRTGLELRIKHPEQLGADIICNCAAAAEIASSPIVILDMGTATTLTVIDKKLTIQGIVIIPGLKSSLEALYNSAAQLSEPIFSDSPELLGKDTNSAICSGVINGNAYMVDGFIRNIRDELSITGTETKLTLIATGGSAMTILPCLRNKFIYAKTLTLQGLAVLYRKNVKN